MALIVIAECDCKCLLSHLIVEINLYICVYILFCFKIARIAGQEEGRCSARSTGIFRRNVRPIEQLQLRLRAVQVSISSTYYAQIFCTNVISAAFI